MGGRGVQNSSQAYLAGIVPLPLAVELARGLGGAERELLRGEVLVAAGALLLLVARPRLPPKSVAQLLLINKDDFKLRSSQKGGGRT